MTFEQAVLRCFRRYTTLEARAPRAEYWWFVFFVVLLLVAAFTLGTLWPAGGAVLLLGTVFGVPVPLLAVMVRRMHDAGWSGIWMFLVFLPFGGIALLAILMWPGERGENRYGPPPRGLGANPDRDGPRTKASWRPTPVPRVTLRRPPRG